MKTLIIAEAGVNHNGSLENALRLVEVAKESGADIVKFQSFTADKLASDSAPKASYQKQTTSKMESQKDMLRKLELSRENHHKIMGHCKSVGIEFLSTPFDIENLHFLTQECGLKKIKIGSGDLNNGPLLREVARQKVEIILSTGMSYLEEVAAALEVLSERNVSLLHCVSQYPAPLEQLNLRAILTLKNAFNLTTGFSDHSMGIDASVAAVALGAEVIEKHFTLDRNQPGPDHLASLEPHELKEMVTEIRRIEGASESDKKQVLQGSMEVALGHGRKEPLDCELDTRNVARRSLVAVKSIGMGESFSEDNIGVKRPGNGISPMLYWNYLGKTASRSYNVDEMIQE